MEASFRRKHALSLRLSFGKVRGRVVRLSVAEVWEVGFKDPQRSSRHASARARGEGEVRGRGGRVPRRVDISASRRVVQPHMIARTASMCAGMRMDAEVTDRSDSGESKQSAPRLRL